MRLAVISALGLVACESAGPDALAIRSVDPPSWDLSDVPTSVTVEGDGFHLTVVTHVARSPGVRVGHRFSGTLGGLALDVELVTNGILRFPPPAELGSGIHDLVIVAPDGRSVRAPGAVRVGAGLELPQVVVTGSGDENDLPDTNPTEEDAGAQVSLREAILIANAADEPHAIRFEEDVVITIDSGDELPAITLDGTVIDGSGADVVITGAGVTDFRGLVVEANDVTIAGIRVESFNGSDNHCIAVDGDNFHLLDCEFFECDDANAAEGAQVALDRGTGAVVRGCRFESGHRDGLRLAAASSDGLIESNTMVDNGDDGLNIVGPGHVVRGNVMTGNGGAGIECLGATGSHLLIEGNHLNHNGWGGSAEDNGSGVMVKWGSTDIRIVDCTFEENLEDAVQITRNDTSGITVSRATFDETQLRAIRVRDGANDGILPPTIDSFDGTVVTGNALVAAGAIVEVYAVNANGDASYATTTVTGVGSWSATLPSAAPTVAATVTIDGSTSELSAFSTPP